MAAIPTPATLTSHTITVLLVDDQAIVGAAVKKMLESESDIVFHHVQDPTKAVQAAKDLNPTVILQDLVMPDIDGLTLVKFFRAAAETKDVPLIVLSTKEEATTKAQAFALGANDYLVKLPDKLEVIARIRYHSQGYINLLQRNEAFRRLEASQKALAEEINQASKYVQSLLPKPLQGPVSAQWKFIPSTTLGGDSFGYHWLDPDHFAVYLLDVCGHGVGSALLSVSAMNVITSQSLPNTDFRDPAQVLKALNDAFQMEKHDEKYFTIWYGVYQKSTRRLTYCGGGHPSSLLFDPAGKLQQLESQGPGVGMWIEYPFESASVDVPAGGRLFLYSDGAFEIHITGGSMWKFSEFLDFLTAQVAANAADPIDRLYSEVLRLHGPTTLEDDFSVVEVRFAGD